jgi:hypothetical protein
MPYPTNNALDGRGGEVAASRPTMPAAHQVGGRGLKLDAHAAGHWGRAYDDIPKSVFATVAWHLANVASDSCDTPGAAEARFREELAALSLSGILPETQAKRAEAAVAKAIAAAEGR